MNWLRKLVGLGGTAKNLTSLNEEDCKEEVKAFAEKTHLNLFQGNVQNLYSTQRIKETSVCPRCESKTEKKVAIFVCATNTLPQIIISTANHFCTNCSSAIIDDKLLQKSCEKGKVYRGIIGLYVKENIQTYQSLNEYIIRYHYDQNSNPSGIKITGDKIAAYDSKIHGSKGTKSQHKVPSSPVTLMDRVERRDKRESLTDSKFRKNSNDRSNQDENDTQTEQELNDKAARSERARIAMENVGKKGRSKIKPKSKEDFADSVNETKQDFKDKVEQKSNFSPKKKQKSVVENPNDKQASKQEVRQEKQIEAKQIEARQIEARQEETKNLSAPQKQAPPARASQRKKQTSTSDKKEEENVIAKQTDKKQNVVEAKQDSKVETAQTTENKIVDATPINHEENAAPKKNRRYKQKRSTRKTRSDKRPVRNTVETEQETPTNEVKGEAKNEPKVELKNEQTNEPKNEPKSEQKNQQTRKQQPKRQNAQKQKEVAQEVENKAQSKASNKETDKADKTINKDNKQNQSPEQPKKESVIEKLHQNLQESSKASIAPKEEKQKEQQKESSRLARLKQEDTEEKVSRRRPRTNVRPPIELDLKNVNPRRRYNNTKKK